MHTNVCAQIRTFVHAYADMCMQAYTPAANPGLELRECENAVHIKSSQQLYRSGKVSLLITAPNVVVKWLTLLHRFREVQRSNLGPEIGYTD
jgi:hypothetical protein